MTSDFMRILAAYLHVLGVASYLGGSIVMEFVLTPAQKFIPPAQAMVVGQKAADRFLAVAWGALGLIAFSGVLRLFTLENEGILTEGLFDAGYGLTLGTMIVLWAVLVVNGSVITFVLRPKLAGRLQGTAGAAQVESRQAEQVQAAQWITRLTRVDLGIALLIAFVGSSLGLAPLF